MPITQQTEAIITLEGVGKRFGDFHALKACSMLVHKGQKIVLCGPSGSGKSTLIRCINRLEEHDSGRIVVAGTELTRNMPDIAAVQSEIGMVFQQFNLFPHLTVVENLMLAPGWCATCPGRRHARSQCTTWRGSGFPSRQTNFRSSSPAGSSSASRSRAPCA